MPPGNLKLASLLFLLLILFTSNALATRADSPKITVLSVKGTINPVLTDYIKRVLAHAEQDGAVPCILQLDTPGGLDNAMRDIVQHIVGSGVPMAVHVSPSGARAASAGVFITLAGHIAAIAPNTVIGALILFKGGRPLFSISPWLIATVVIAIVGSFTFIVYKVIAAQRKPAFTGPEEIVGASATVKKTLNPAGVVLFRGENWTAISESGTIKPDEEVTITRYENLKLWVTRKNKGGSQ